MNESLLIKKAMKISLLGTNNLNSI